LIYISHRGNLEGKNPDKENKPEYINLALYAGYQCEVDLWYIEHESFGKGFYLGHDEPLYKVTEDYLHTPGLWLHCKNFLALWQLQFTKLNYFWHNNDDYTLTSHGWIWAYPGFPTANGAKAIAVLPEIDNTNTEKFSGICSDFIANYANEVNTV